MAVFGRTRGVGAVGGGQGGSWWRQSQRRRVLGSAAVGLLVGVAAARVAPWQFAVLVGWDLVAVLVLSRVWFRVGRFSADQTKAFATREDNSRASAELLLITASVASLGGAAFGLLKAHPEPPNPCHIADGGERPHRGTLVARGPHRLRVALRARVLHDNTPWRDRFQERPVQARLRRLHLRRVHGRHDVQVSDTDIGNRLIRHTVLRHALISYLFGAIIVALMVNVMATLLGG
jgi:hypothetical protein